MEWQPIETAPKDTGHPVLLYLDPVPNTNDVIGYVPLHIAPIVVGWWDLEGWDCGFSLIHVDDDGYVPTLDIRPTHWMPLPEPPDRAGRSD